MREFHSTHSLGVLLTLDDLLDGIFLQRTFEITVIEVFLQFGTQKIGCYNRIWCGCCHF